MNIKNVFAIAALISISWPAYADKDWRVGADLNIASINYSEPVTIKANFDDWETDQFQAGEKLYAKQVARAGMHFNNIQIGYSKNLYYYLNFSEDMALLHYLERNGKIDEHKTPFKLYLNANNAEGEGVYLGYKTAWRALEVGARLTYLTLQDLYYGQAEGIFDPAQSFSNSTSLVIDYAYPEDRIFDRYVAPPEGKGLILDLHFRYEWQQHFLAGEIGEAYSDLYWNTAPGSLIQGNLSDLLEREDAAVQFNHFRARFHQRLPVHTQLQYRYQIRNFLSTGFEYEKLDKKSWEKLNLNWHFGSAWTGTLKWDPSDSIWGISINHPYFLLDLETDSADYKKSHYLRFIIQARMTI